MEDAKTAVYFYEKCSELARLTGDKGRQMLSNNRLGDVYDKAGDLGSAIDYHEKHRELAIAESMRKEVLKANGELVKVGQHAMEGGGHGLQWPWQPLPAVGIGSGEAHTGWGTPWRPSKPHLSWAWWAYQRACCAGCRCT
jgi:hypothetical protein